MKFKLKYLMASCGVLLLLGGCNQPNTKDKVATSSESQTSSKKVRTKSTSSAKTGEWQATFPSEILGDYYREPLISGAFTGMREQIRLKNLPNQGAWMNYISPVQTDSRAQGYIETRKVADGYELRNRSDANKTIATITPATTGSQMKARVRMADGTKTDYTYWRQPASNTAPNSFQPENSTMPQGLLGNYTNNNDVWTIAPTQLKLQINGQNSVIKNIRWQGLFGQQQYKTYSEIIVTGQGPNGVFYAHIIDASMYGAKRILATVGYDLPTETTDGLSKLTIMPLYVDTDQSPTK
ncbi:MAG: hypothetical protein LKF36_07800 [Lactobacillus sp.]|nr:hypothetical protein [Lactobacillus sp.]